VTTREDFFVFIGPNLAARGDAPDNRRVADQERTAAPDPPRLGARGEDLVHYATAFGLLFLAGFALVVFVLLSRRRRKTRGEDDS
jgi:hypothetical protein